MKRIGRKDGPPQPEEGQGGLTAPASGEPSAPADDRPADSTGEAGAADQSAAGRVSPPDNGSETPPGESQPAPEGPADPAAAYLEQLQRLKAEFDNFRRRNAREREEWFLAARLEVMRQLLPVIDDLRRAREHCPEEVTSPEAAGLLLILKRFEDIVKALGLETQSPEVGAEFDPEQHEAVMTSSSAEVAEGGILQTVEPGYFFQGRMLRPSKVCVSSGPAPE